MSLNNADVLRKPMSRAEVLNVFMRSVYNWMFTGLAVTAVISFALTYTPLNSIMLNPSIGILGIICMVVELGLVFYISARINKLSAGTATGLFLLYSALNGFTLSIILMAYSVGSVAQAFITATAMFGAMSVYGLVTKRDLSGMGRYLFMGLIGLIVAMVINMFLGSSSMDLLISLVGVALFLGLTAHDTQRLNDMGASMPADDAVAVRRGAVYGALVLYLDFINLFLFLLRLFGGSRD